MIGFFIDTIKIMKMFISLRHITPHRKYFIVILLLINILFEVALDLRKVANYIIK